MLLLQKPHAKDHVAELVGPPVVYINSKKIAVFMYSLTKYDGDVRDLFKTLAPIEQIQCIDRILDAMDTMSWLTTDAKLKNVLYKRVGDGLAFKLADIEPETFTHTNWEYTTSYPSLGFLKLVRQNINYPRAWESLMATDPNFKHETRKILTRGSNISFLISVLDELLHDYYDRVSVPRDLSTLARLLRNCGEGDIDTQITCTKGIYWYILTVDLASTCERRELWISPDERDYEAFMSRINPVLAHCQTLLVKLIPIEETRDLSRPATPPPSNFASSQSSFTV
jgi:hypothetical protein